MPCIQHTLNGLECSPSLMVMLYHTLCLGLEYTIYSPLGLVRWNAGKFHFEGPFLASLNGTLWVDALAAHQLAVLHYNPWFPFEPLCIRPYQKPQTLLHLPNPTGLNYLALFFWRLFSIHPLECSRRNWLEYSHPSYRLCWTRHPTERGFKLMLYLFV